MKVVVLDRCRRNETTIFIPNRTKIASEHVFTCRRVLMVYAFENITLKRCMLFFRFSDREFVQKTVKTLSVLDGFFVDISVWTLSPGQLTRVRVAESWLS